MDRAFAKFQTRSTSNGPADDAPKKLPKGIVLGKDGKPCRSCTSFASWAALTKQQAKNEPPQSPTSASEGSPSAATENTTSLPSDCPPDVDALGRQTWTLLHTIAATYPEQPTPAQRADVTSFLSLFGRLYPCWVCADDFRAWMRREPVDATGQEGLSGWMCRAHNDVNRKLGKPEFDCARWRERWKDGWRDGRCG